MSNIHTILGAGGAIGIELAKCLTHYTSQIRLVSRNPKKINQNDQLLAANLLEGSEVDKAVEGSSIVYITIGFPYQAKVWQESWPKFMGHVLQSCKKHQCKLAFLDNIYMYDAAHIGHMTESTPINPANRPKGMVRTQILNMLKKEVESGQLKALVARSADFYGPEVGNNSVLSETVFKNFHKGKKAQWLASVNYKHSYTYTPDAGKAMALLAHTPEAYDQEWHLPTASPALTGKEWIEAIAHQMGVQPRYQVLSKGLMKFLGLFMPIMREISEVYYQNNQDYIFDSSKFEKHFNFHPTPYLEGIKEIVARGDYK